ncbi:hypothetical protein [Jatrophihabitans endophyticus]|uniref:hypothetical protein n=1 Tax=Jatrophihabitans endophyticus TaxID=1206085 RepID=UPI0019E169E8|nr:hypothetical protein [Jatrophihabitans endophyticus]MBE7186836.1 hypothetical protein [Jatrophihabitans endophyticus]
MDVRIVGPADATEVAALLAVLSRAHPAVPDRLSDWRRGRRAALRPARQQTR